MVITEFEEGEESERETRRYGSKVRCPNRSRRLVQQRIRKSRSGVARPTGSLERALPLLLDLRIRCWKNRWAPKGGTYRTPKRVGAQTECWCVVVQSTRRLFIAISSGCKPWLGIPGGKGGARAVVKEEQYDNAGMNPTHTLFLPDLGARWMPTRERIRGSSLLQRFTRQTLGYLICRRRIADGD